MGVVINPSSEYGKELLKWEQHRTKYVPEQDDNGDSVPPGNPYVYRHFPLMLYKAQKSATGRVECLRPAPEPYAFERADQLERAILAVETFNRSCQRIVKSEGEEARAKADGWRDSPKAALDHFEALEQDMARAAAEAAYAAKGMTAKAKAELAEADAATHEHVVDVVAARNPRGRPKKGSHAVTGTGQVEA